MDDVGVRHLISSLCFSSSSSGLSKTYLKILVSDAQADHIIGTSGTKIQDFRSRSSAQIQILNDVVFPVITERVVMICGSPDEVLTAMALLLDKILPEVNDS